MSNCKKRGFLLPLHRHREASYPGFLLSDDGTRAIGGKAVFKGSSGSETLFWHQKTAVSLGVAAGQRKNTEWTFFPCILLLCRLDTVLVVLLT